MVFTINTIIRHTWHSINENVLSEFKNTLINYTQNLLDYKTNQYLNATTILPKAIAIRQCNKI